MEQSGVSRLDGVYRIASLLQQQRENVTAKRVIINNQDLHWHGVCSLSAKSIN
jgi:hypothetical protein